MAYIGVDINYGSIAKQTGTGDGSDTTPIAALTYTVPSNESILVFLDGVAQVPGTDFTATGTTLTFTTAPANGVAILVMFLGRSLDIGTPGANTVDETKLKDALIGDFSDVTVTAADTFLYGDATDSGNTKKDTIQGVLDLVSAGGFEVGCKAYSGVAQTFATATRAIVELELESYDLNNDFNTTTDRYVVPTTGEYLVIGGCKLVSVLDAKQYQTELQINGTVITYTISHGSHTAHYLDIVSDIYQLTAGQYVQMSVFQNSGSDKSTDPEIGTVFLSVHRLS